MPLTRFPLKDKKKESHAQVLSVTRSTVRSQRLSMTVNIHFSILVLTLTLVLLLYKSFMRNTSKLAINVLVFITLCRFVF